MGHGWNVGKSEADSGIAIVAHKKANIGEPMIYRLRRSLAGILILSGAAIALVLASEGDANKQTSRSYGRDVFPIVQKYCLPCHAEESFNKSELSLDSHEQLMEGGKHGPPIVPGKPGESLLLKKLSNPPPFGDQMPPPRRQRAGQPPKRLTEEEIRILTEWIEQGALKN